MSFAAPSFSLEEIEVDDRTSVITVSGDVHVSTAPEFSRLLADAIGRGRVHLVLDLHKVDFIDSTGLSVLLNALRRITRSGGQLMLVCSNPTVLRLFEITRLDTTFDIRPTRKEALSRMKQL